MLKQYTINPKKMSKCKHKKIVQYQPLYYEYSPFPKLCDKSYSVCCPKEPGKETDLKILTYCTTTVPLCQCIGIQELLQNNPNAVTMAKGKVIELAIQIMDSDNHYIATNNTTDVKIPSAFEKNIQSTYISALDNNYCNSDSISNVQKILCLLVAENNLTSFNNEVATRAEFTKIFKLIIDVNSFVHQAALSRIFSNWYFLNIAQGLQIKYILRSININTIAKIDNILCLILCKASTNRKFMLHFVTPIPLNEYSYVIHCMRLVHSTKDVATDNDISEPITKVIEDTHEFEINVSDQCTQTIYIKTYIDVDSNTDLEEVMATNQDLIKPEEHSLNANLWLPTLSGESCDDKISLMMYVLKCSCKNEALVNLDVAEKYVRNIYDFMLSPSFHRILLKHLGKSLLSTFFNIEIF